MNYYILNSAGLCALRLVSRYIFILLLLVTLSSIFPPALDPGNSAYQLMLWSKNKVVETNRKTLSARQTYVRLVGTSLFREELFNTFICFDVEEERL